MKKNLILMSILGFLVLTPNVSAKEVYYENEKGVTFTKEEYDFLTYMFWDGSQDLMTLSDYVKFIDSDIMNGELDSRTYDMSKTRATSITDANRTLKISKSCSTNCLISTTLTWKTNPAVRSYEVMGAYLENTKLVNTPTTVVTSTGTTISSKEIKNFSNGFGVSIQLPVGNSLVVNQNFRVATGGHVYASYQHAKSPISLANSKNYTLSRSGYGGVFQFSGIASSTYDKMNGVDI